MREQGIYQGCELSEISPTFCPKLTRADIPQWNHAIELVFASDSAQVQVMLSRENLLLWRRYGLLWKTLSTIKEFTGCELRNKNGNYSSKINVFVVMDQSTLLTHENLDMSVQWNWESTGNLEIVGFWWYMLVLL